MSVHVPHDDLFTFTIGNTHSSVMLWHDGVDIGSQQWQTGRAIDDAVKRLLRNRRAAPIVLAGVVPKYKESLRRALRALDRQVLIFRETLWPALIVVPRPAANVGDDRLAAALGALYVNPNVPWIVIDAGTAVTINAVSPGMTKGLPRFEGGLIFPGAQMAMNALAMNSGQLPRVSAQKTRRTTKFIGKSTVEAIKLGVQHSEAFAAVTLAREQSKLYGGESQFAVTGGRAPAVLQAFELAGELVDRVHYIPNLVHLGLYVCWHQSRKRAQ